jgi:hypothetical protein
MLKSFKNFLSWLQTEWHFRKKRRAMKDEDPYLYK